MIILLLITLCTSVLAQLQLIAVQRKMFISSMMRKRTPKVIVSHRSQAGRIPSSQFKALSRQIEIDHS